MGFDKIGINLVLAKIILPIVKSATSEARAVFLLLLSKTIRF